MTAGLNVFQKTQRLWDTVHPYNAAQAMELVGDFSADHVDASFSAAIADLGLGAFVCDGRRYFIDRSVGPVSIERPADGFEALMAREMNRPFDSARSFPFRPFDLIDNGRRLIGLTYQHWVADSVSIRMLMRQWFRRLLGGGGPCPVRLPPAGLIADYGPAAAGWSTVAQTASLLSFLSRMKWMRRVDDKTDASVGVLLRSGPAGLIDAIKPRARAAGATIGDVLLAAAASTLNEVGPGHRTTHRPDLAMGTIVDLRARRAETASNVFGLYLGFTMTPFAARELSNFDRLLARTAAVRRSGLARRAAEASQLNIALGYLMARNLKPKKRREFYRKRFPLSGGLSSVHMTPGWAGDAHPAPLAAYHRVSPTGPMLPLVLTPTTLGKRFDLCCTYRSALMDGGRAATIVDGFFNRLVRYAG